MSLALSGWAVGGVWLMEGLLFVIQSCEGGYYRGISCGQGGRTGINPPLMPGPPGALGMSTPR